MTTAVVYDLTRLLLRSFAGSPNGIDRVDRNLARHFLRDEALENRGVLLNKLRPTVLAHRSGAKLLAAVDKAWKSDSDLAQDRAYQSVRQSLLAPPGRTLSRAGRIGRPPGATIATALRMASIVLPGLARPQPVPRNAAFIHATQFPSPRFFQWLERRPDIKPIFFIHDLLPSQKPEWFTAKNVEQHRQFMDVYLRYGRAAIVNTETVRKEVVEFTRLKHGAERPVLVAPMPAESLFAGAGLFDAEMRTIPYFVMCGTIEPRKNHRLILDLWQKMVRQYGDAAPRLAILGRRGWNNRGVFEQLDRAPWAKSHIVEAAGLSSEAVASIVANARALLMPSFAEGYGFPIVEALAAGTRVVASDIPVFKEVADKNVTYCDLNDDAAWLDAINLHMSFSAKSRAGILETNSLLQSWEVYYRNLDMYLEGI